MPKTLIQFLENFSLSLWESGMELRGKASKLERAGHSPTEGKVSNKADGYKKIQTEIIGFIQDAEKAINPKSVRGVNSIKGDLGLTEDGWKQMKVRVENVGLEVPDFDPPKEDTSRRSRQAETEEPDSPQPTAALIFFLCLADWFLTICVFNHEHKEGWPPMKWQISKVGIELAGSIKVVSTFIAIAAIANGTLETWGIWGWATLRASWGSIPMLSTTTIHTAGGNNVL